MQTLQNLLYSTIHRSPKKAETLADEMGINHSTLCRYGLPITDDVPATAIDIPLRRWIQLMKTSVDYSSLHMVNRMCGLLSVPIPKPLAGKADANDLVSQYQDATAVNSRLLVNFFKNPTDESLETLENGLTYTMRMEEQLRRTAQKRNQLDLPFGQ